MEDDRTRIRLEFAAEMAAELAANEVKNEEIFNRAVEDRPELAEKITVLRAGLIRYNREVIQRFMDMK